MHGGHATSVLITTLGGTWSVVPEAFGIAAPRLFALSADDAFAGALGPDVPEPQELWVLTTASTDEPVAAVTRWWRAIGEPMPLRVFKSEAADGSAQTEVECIRELIFRAVLAAAPDGLLCLAGGRKTMSADLQRAGGVFGCRAMFHVLPPEPVPEVLRNHDFTTPLPASVTIRPVLIGRHEGAAHLSLAPPITRARFPLPPEDVAWAGPDDDNWLSRKIEQREREAGSLLAAAHVELAKTEKLAGWRGLYRLTPARIAELRRIPVGPRDRDLLERLPKAELHCHLGGVLGLKEQVEVGRKLWASLPPSRRAAAESACAELDWSDPWSATRRLRASEIRADMCACLLQRHDAAVWRERLIAPTEPRLALQERGFEAYELPGELSGSALLTEPLAIAPYAAQVVECCRRQGLMYLELRGSPSKYRPLDPVGWLRDFKRALEAELKRVPEPLEIRFIVVADRRHQYQRAAEVIHIALAARRDVEIGEWVVGVDLAGDENAARNADFTDALEAAFEECLTVTIHAGEGTAVGAIWDAAYRLHADRIGHGLSLAEDPKLARRFRNRRICLELCPTSNRQVVGYRDPAFPGADREYPLRELLELGVPLTLCTDNPGISETTLADEYIAASRMTRGGITWWEALGMIRQGFVHAFCERDLIDAMLVEADRRVCELITQSKPAPPPDGARSEPEFDR